MGLLNGGVKALFGEIFSPVFLPAQITDHAQTYTGDGSLRRGTAARACRAQVNRCTERMLGATDYTDTDRAVLVLAATLDGDLTVGSEIVVLEGPYAGTPFRTATPIDRDPAGAYWRARGVRVKAAAGG